MIEHTSKLYDEGNKPYIDITYSVGKKVGSAQHISQILKKTTNSFDDYEIGVVFHWSVPM